MERVREAPASASAEVTWHAKPQCGLFGDPKPIVWGGVTHVFFQNSPGGGFEGMRWAHVTTRDLLRWERMPDALVPEPGGPDAFGCWTGSVLRAGGCFHLFYTGVAAPAGGGQSVCHATSDDLVTWTRDPRNPILVPVEPFAIGPDAAWRDPQVVPEVGGGYRMLLTADAAAAPRALRGCVAHFRSDDLDLWEPLGTLHHPASVHRCECPDLFEAGGRSYLIYSDFGVQVREAQEDGRFRPPPVAQLDDFRYYAAKTALDDGGRRLMFGFLFGRRAPHGPTTDSSPWEWGGVMACPREVGVHPDGELRVEPARELEGLRREALPLDPERRPGLGRLGVGAGGWTLRAAEAGGEFAYRMLGEVPQEAELTMLLDARAGDGSPFGLLFGCDAELTRGYALEVQPRHALIVLRRLMPEHNPSGLVLQQVELAPAPAQAELRVLLDRTVVEAFVDGRSSLSGRLYGAVPEARLVGVFTRGGALDVVGARAWRLGLPPDVR